MSIFITRHFVALALLCAGTQAQVPDLTTATKSDQGVGSAGLATGTVADILGINMSMRKLASSNFNCDNPMDFLLLRQGITASILAASLDVQSVVAEIDHERAQILELRTVLSDNRDRKLNWITLATLVSGAGSGVAATALQFNDRTANLGNSIGIVGSAAGVLFSVMALRQNGGTGSLGIAPNMLAPLFDRKPELRSVYPESVWKYLNTAPYEDPKIKTSWRTELLGEWTKLGRIEPLGTPRGSQKIDQLTSRIGERRKLSIDLLKDRAAMLTDLRARVSLMSADLRNIMKETLSRTPCPSSSIPE